MIFRENIVEQESEKGIQDYIGILKRNKHKMLIIAGCVFIAMIVLALKWPATYKSTATILIEQQEIPQDLVRSTVTSFADQRIQVISHRVMSSINLKKIIEKFDLYRKEKKIKPISLIVESMRDYINLEMVSADVVDPQSGRPIQATIAFTLSFENESAKKAQQVANELVNLYLNENLKRRSEIASEATSFLSIEANKLSQLMSGLEEELAVFKEKNEDSLPELQKLNMSLMDRTEQQLMEVNRKLTAAADKILYLNTQLSQIEPNMTVFSETGERIYGSKDRLKMMQSQIVSLTAKYARDHPDVISMQKEIIALETEVGGVDKLELFKQLKDKRAEMIKFSERYSADHPDVIKLKQQVVQLQMALDKPSKAQRIVNVKPDNPAYIQLSAQFKSAKAERVSMLTLRNKLLVKITKFERGLLKSPQIERQYLELTREYENTLMKFREVKAKQMEADMAQAMEKDRKAERFTLIEPPLFPEEPFKPNRKAIIFLGLILSMGLAVAFAFINESLRPSIYGARGLFLATGAEPLVVIPFVENFEDIQASRRLKIRAVFLTIGVVTLILIGFQYFIMPLDVFWYVLLRKLEFN